MNAIDKSVLLIEDDDEIRELLSTLLVREGFKVDTATSGLEGESIALTKPFDIIILDIMLPGKDGLSVLKELRPRISTPILMLTAKGETFDRTLGLELGADDYLPKPFDVRELIARLKALLRRVEIDNQKYINGVADMTLASITLKPTRREAIYQGTVLDLTSTEFDILSYLMASHNVIVSKEVLTEKTLGRKLSLHDRAIDMHMSNLRKKLPGDSIKTIRGVGYMFDANLEGA